MRAIALAALVLVVGACSSETPTAKPFSSGSGTSSSSSGGKDEEEDDDDDDDRVGPGTVPPVVVDPDAGSSKPPDSAAGYRGILSATPTVKFGGVAPHCSYDVTMKAIEMELAITPSGTVISGTAKNNMVERLVGTCANPALGSVPQTFNLATVNGADLTFTGTGGPKTKLTTKLTKAGASWEAALTWERTDRTDDLKWVVRTKITLGPK